jgi:hypothetical protein
LIELLCVSSVAFCGAWLAGFLLLVFGVKNLGFVVCLFALYVGLPFILLAVVCVSTSAAQYMRPRSRLIVFSLGILTMADMILRGLAGWHYG